MTKSSVKRRVLACSLLVLAGAASSAGAAARLPRPAPPVENRTLRQQVLLDRAPFSPGEIDGRMGSTTALALQAFARERVVDTTGSLEGAAWLALSADTAPTLVPHTLTPADVAGPQGLTKLIKARRSQPG